MVFGGELSAWLLRVWHGRGYRAFACFVCYQDFCVEAYGCVLVAVVSVADVN